MCIIYEENKKIYIILQHYLPLRDVFESSFENDIAFCEQTYEAVKHVQDRFIKVIQYYYSFKRKLYASNRRNFFCNIYI